MQQRDLFDTPPMPPAQRHSATSREAAAAVEPSAETLRRIVLSAIRGAGDTGLTDEEGQTLLEMTGNTYRPRRRECEQAGLVRDSGRTRSTRSGRKAVVWVAA